MCSLVDSLLSSRSFQLLTAGLPVLQDWLAHDDVQLAAYFPFFQVAGVQDVQVCLHDRCKLTLARCLMPAPESLLSGVDYLHPALAFRYYRHYT